MRMSALCFDCARSFRGRYAAPLGHIPILLLSVACLAERQQILICSLREPPVYHTRSEHAKHYTTNAVKDNYLVYDQYTCFMSSTNALIIKLQIYIKKKLETD